MLIPGWGPYPQPPPQRGAPTPRRPSHAFARADFFLALRLGRTGAGRPSSAAWGPHPTAAVRRCMVFLMVAGDWLVLAS